LLRSNGRNESAAKAARLTRTLRIVIGAFGILVLGGCSAFRYASASVNGYRHTQNLRAAVRQFLAENPIGFRIITGITGPFPQGDIYLSSLERHKILERYALHANAEVGLIGLRLGARGRALAQRDQWPKYYPQNSVYVVNVGNLQLAHVTSMRPMFPPWPKICYEVDFVAHFSLTKAGKDLMPFVPPTVGLAVGLAPYEGFRASFTPRFSDAGKDIPGGLMVCRLQGGIWGAYFAGK